MSVKIVNFEIENVKRVALVQMAVGQTGLTIIGGDNAQGKTSILDAIIYALGGERYRPSNLQREGGLATARIRLELSNGLVVERKGKNATLSVTDPTGARFGQKLLDSFLEELALNLPKFLAMPGREKAQVLLRILGIGDQLAALDREEKAAYDERLAQGRIADQKKKHANEMPEHHDAPDELLTAGDLVAASQAIMQRNAERANARRCLKDAQANLWRKEQRVAELRAMLDTAEREAAEAGRQLNAADIVVGEDESTAEIQAKLAELELINAKVRQNMDKAKAKEDAEAAQAECQKRDEILNEIRLRRLALLNGAVMPLPGLSIQDGELTYNGKAWDCMSGAEQIRAGVAIIQKLKPECGFVLLDKLEMLDVRQLAELNAYLEANNLQAIGTRVSTGAECTLVIEDGMVAGAPAPAADTSLDY